VIIMDHTRKLDPRLVWAGIAGLLAAAVLWAGTALAADGSSTSSDPSATGNAPAQSAQQDEGNGEAPAREDCPEPGNAGPGGAGGSESDGGGYPSDPGYPVTPAAPAV
jgi:hypothetical protein